MFIWARLAKVELTTESFHRELANQESRHDFVAYWARTVEENKAKGLVTKSTATSHSSSLTTLGEYRAELPLTN